MMYEPRDLARRVGRRKPWTLFVMIGYAIAAVGFFLLPTIILSPIAVPIIVAGFAFSLGAYLTGKFRASALRRIRHGEREESSFLD
jgi:Na+/melibiose symporter-like transporter